MHAFIFFLFLIFRVDNLCNEKTHSEWLGHAEWLLIYHSRLYDFSMSTPLMHILILFYAILEAGLFTSVRKDFSYQWTDTIII